jgi:hypothetical protein
MLTKALFIAQISPCPLGQLAIGPVEFFAVGHKLDGNVPQFMDQTGLDV